MTPVMQTQFVATHGKGNCVQAAVASILDLPLEAVPAFRDAECLENAIDKYLQSVDLRRIAISFGGGFEWGDASMESGIWHPIGECRLSGGPVLMFGKSPRGNFGHSIVASINGCNWRMLHDPHPDNTGIVGDPRSIHWIVPAGSTPNSVKTPLLFNLMKKPDITKSLHALAAEAIRVDDEHESLTVGVPKQLDSAQLKPVLGDVAMESRRLHIVLVGLMMKAREL